MIDPTSSSPAADPAGDDPLVCPHCGYDLRASAADRCSECGQVIDHANLRTSGFPWARRRHRGRVRTYLRTVWLVTIGSRTIAHEASRPQDPADARSFRRVTTAFVAVALLGAFALLLLLNDGYATLAARPEPYRAANVPDKWLQDVVVPWSAAATLPPVMPLMLIGLAFHFTTVHRRLFRLRGRPARQRERAGAIAHYAIAPMVLLFPAVLWWSGFEVFVHLSDYPRDWFFTHLLVTGIVLALPAWLLLAAALLLSIVRITQWSTRVRGGGLERTVIDVPYLLALWALGLIVWLLVLPWCVGFVWIVVDSLR